MPKASASSAAKKSTDDEYEIALWDLAFNGSSSATAARSTKGNLSEHSSAADSKKSSKKKKSDDKKPASSSAKKSDKICDSTITPNSSNKRKVESSSSRSPSNNHSEANSDKKKKAFISTIMAKVHSALHPDTRHYSVTLPSSVKASDVVHVRLPLAFGERIVSVTCPPNLPSAKYNKRRSLIVVISNELEAHLESLMEGEMFTREDEDDGVDCQFEWRDLESLSSEDMDVQEEKKEETPNVGDDCSTSSSNAFLKSSSPATTPSKGSSSSGTTYMDMAHFAIQSLKERNGSSIPALLKHITSTFADKLDGKKNVKNHLVNALKSGVKAGRFVRLRNSFKLDSEWVKKEKAKKVALQKKKDRQRLFAASEEKTKKQSLSGGKKEEEDEAKAEEARQAKAEEARLEKLRQERIRRRKFPMDDLQLIQEDLELLIPSPVDPRPVLPLAFPPLNPSVVEDILHIYNILFGDVGYFSSYGPLERCSCPEFSLKQLGSAFIEMEWGNTKRAKCLPPLLLHLLTTLLRKLLSIEDDDAAANKESLSTSDNRDAEGIDDIVAQRRADFDNLNDALTPSSCGEIVRLYMELMDRLSIERYPTGYLEEDEENGKCCDGQGSNINAPFFFGYLGPPSGILHSAVKKLVSYDIWCLEAEDIACILTTLCDDILSRKGCVAKTISERGDLLNDLLKSKKNADAQFRKSRLAYEGPKTNKKKGAKRSSDPNQDENADLSRGEENVAENTLDDKAIIYVPTISQDEFESSKLEMEKANAAYTKGLRKYASRTEPIGYDRDRNAVYFFSSDPTAIFIEMRCNNSTSPSAIEQNNSTWHVIETKSLYDAYTSSLDQRGIREKELYEMLAVESARKSLYDDVKELNDIKLARRRIQELDKRLANARLAVQIEDVSGRRSGRLASIAQTELVKVEEEMRNAMATVEEKERPRPPPCYQSLTGLEILCDYDIACMKEYLKETPNIKVSFKKGSLPKHIAGLRGSEHAATPLWKAGGVVEILASEMLELEGWISSLAPREKIDAPEQDWKVKVRETIAGWKQIAMHCIGPTEQETLPNLKCIMQDQSAENEPTPLKRNSVGLAHPISEMELLQTAVSGVLGSLKAQLLELEETMRSISGLEHTSQLEEMASLHDSESEESIDENHQRQRWKTLIEKLNRIDTKKHAVVRHKMIDAITSARDAGQSKVVGELREALKKYRDGSAGAAKLAALEVLSRHGGIVSEKEPQEDMDTDDDLASVTASLSEGEDGRNESLLTEDAAALGACIDGSDDAGRDEWVEAVKNCKTISRFAALMQTLVQKAMEVLGKLEEGHDSLWSALALWQKQQSKESLEIAPRRITRNSKVNTKPPPKKKETEKTDAETFFWIYCSRTSEVVLAKSPGRPWWPAFVCHPIDQKMVRALASTNRVLLCYVGREELHVVKGNETKKFSPGVKDTIDASQYDGNLIAKYKSSLALARRVCRAKRAEPH